MFLISIKPYFNMVQISAPVQRAVKCPETVMDSQALLRFGGVISPIMHN
jgi:hypothetical protein